VQWLQTDDRQVGPQVAWHREEFLLAEVEIEEAGQPGHSEAGATTFVIASQLSIEHDFPKFSDVRRKQLWDGDLDYPQMLR